MIAAWLPWANPNIGVTGTRVSHFTAVFLFAMFASVVFGITLREGVRAQVRYGLFCFAWFLGGTLLAGWALYILNPR
jgi:hypothetical protein